MRVFNKSIDLVSMIAHCAPARVSEALRLQEPPDTFYNSLQRLRCCWVSSVGQIANQEPEKENEEVRKRCFAAGHRRTV
jgi:hypothetical protein